MKHLYYSFILIFFISFQGNAQQRYLSEVFSDVTIIDNIQFGTNIGIIQGSPNPENLMMTIYEPTGDTMSERPMFIHLHTGNFLPKGLNGSTTGERQDSSTVEICKRYARHGYVAVAISYRLGWNPIGTQDQRTGTLLNAVYRAVQDGRTAVRFFRDNHATGGNTYKIDPNKIAVSGEGSGGYVAFAMASLDKLSEIQMSKFFDATLSAFYVDTTLSGDWNGIGGTGLNLTNHTGYSSDVAFCANLGGAMGDSTWLEAGDVPMVSFHCPNDPFAPYKYGTVIVPTTGDVVVDVSGSHDIQRITNSMGNNDKYINAITAKGFNDVYTMAANAHNDGHKGLYPFLNSAANGQAAPWQWWDVNDANHTSSLITNPDMSKAKAMAYIDTVFGYMMPRAALTMDIGDALSVGELNYTQNVSVFPNPSTSSIYLMSDEKINDFVLTNYTGQIVKTGSINDNSYVVNRGDMTSGVYFLQINTTTHQEVHKIIFE